MLIPTLGLLLQRALAWYRRREVLDELRRDPRRLRDLGLTIEELQHAMKTADRQQRFGAPLPEEPDRERDLVSFELRVPY